MSFRTFLINLDRDRERLAFIDAALRERGMTYERFTAIYGRDIDTDALIDAEKSLRVEGRPLTPGDVGTAASHRGVYARIIEERIPYALILEDDVQLPMQMQAIVAEEIRKNEQRGAGGWEYLSFDYGTIGPRLFPIWFRSFIPRLKRASVLGRVGILLYGAVKLFYIVPLFLYEYLRNCYAVHYPGPVTFYRPMYNAGAYILTYTGAQKLRDLATPIYCTSDRLPNQARIHRRLRMRWYAPLVVRQIRETFGSTASEQKGTEYKDGTAYVK
jgi:GR25 family glycosyltransferase involved in LPS biosynthesis